MELHLTFLILLPLGLLAGALYLFALRPLWARAVERCESLDAEDAKAAKMRQEAERELHGDIP